jgi:hypothetical protein
MSLGEFIFILVCNNDINLRTNNALFTQIAISLLIYVWSLQKIVSFHVWIEYIVFHKENIYIYNVGNIYIYILLQLIEVR